MLYQLHHCWSYLYLKHYLNLMYQLMMCLSIGWVVFAIHLAPKGGGDHTTGTAGISVDGCSCDSPVGTHVSFGGAWVFFIELGEGLPIPGIDFFEDFPLLTLVVAQFRTSKFFLSTSGRTQNLAPYYWLLGPNAVSCFHPAVRVIDNKQGDGGWIVNLIPILYSKFLKRKG